MFFLVEVNLETDGQYSKALTEFETIDDAIAVFHESIAYAMHNDHVVQLSRCILDSAMMPMRTENWSRPVTNIEPNVVQSEDPDDIVKPDTPVNT